MSVEILTYDALGARLNISPVAARSLARRLRLPRSLSDDVAAFEKNAIERALMACEGDIAGALELLNLPRRTLNEKMTRYGIDRRAFARP